MHNICNGNRMEAVVCAGAILKGEKSGYLAGCIYKR